MKKNIRIDIMIVLLMASTIVPMIGAADNQTNPNNSNAEATWSADVNDDGVAEARGWISFTLEKGIVGRIIKITGAWGTDDGNLTGSFVINNFIFTKFYGTFRGLFTGNVSGDYSTAKFIGFLYNDWEVGYWRTFVPAKIQVQIVHIPFN